MNWHTTTVPAESLVSLLAEIRSRGGIVACSRPGADGVLVTWTTISSEADLGAPLPAAHR